MALTGGSALGTSVANDITAAALYWYVKGKALSQTTQDKPLLRWLRDNKKTFASGNSTISIPVKGTYLSDTAGYLQGFSEDDAINFYQSQNILRATFTWKTTITSLIITHEELLKDGISVVDDSRGGRTVEHAGRAATVLTGLLEDRLADWGESDSRAYNQMYWQDGSQDSKQVAGLTSLLTDTPTAGSTGGLARATYTWWRHRVNLALAASPANGTLIQFLNTELIQLRRYGGKPNKALCGSSFLDALRSELYAKGYFTMTGFNGEKATDLGIGGLHISGMGRFEYDPTMDSLNMSKRCYLLDGSAVKLWTMEGEDQKILNPERPYQYLVLLKNKKCVGSMCVDRLTGNGVYGIA